jgi:DNA-binding transcriptional LysR family regulator
MTQMLTLVELGELMVFLPHWMASRYIRSGISYVPVCDVSPGRLHIAWRAGSRSANVARLVHAATRLASEQEARPGFAEAQSVPSTDNTIRYNTEDCPEMVAATG